MQTLSNPLSWTFIYIQATPSREGAVKLYNPCHTVFVLSKPEVTWINIYDCADMENALFPYVF